MSGSTNPLQSAWRKTLRAFEQAEGAFISFRRVTTPNLFKAQLESFADTRVLAYYEHPDGQVTMVKYVPALKITVLLDDTSFGELMVGIKARRHHHLARAQFLLAGIPVELIR